MFLKQNQCIAIKTDYTFKIDKFIEISGDRKENKTDTELLSIVLRRWNIFDFCEIDINFSISMNTVKSTVCVFFSFDWYVVQEKKCVLKLIFKKKMMKIMKEIRLKLIQRCEFQ